MSEKTKCSCGHHLITILLVILIAISSTQLFLTLAPNTKNAFLKEVLLQHEYDKVGGKENYEVITELQKAFLVHPDNPQNIAAQKEILAQLGGGTNTNQTQATTPTGNVLSNEQMANILENAVLEGNKDAPVVVVEYADLECPYCVVQHNDHQITTNLKADFPDQVTTAFKNHRGVNHSGTEIKALAVLCAEKVGGNDAYVQFYKEIFAGSTTSTYYPVSDLADIAKKIGIDVTAWQSCVDNKETLTQFTEETEEAKKYGMSGTPGTLLFNRNTGKYAVLKGAYSYENFKSTVQSLLAE